MEKINFITLGCSKNTYDSNIMKEILTDKYEIVEEINNADYVVINTCGFIGTAKEESIDTIMDVIELQKVGLVKKIILAGCLSERYKDELAKEIPEISAFIGTGNISSIKRVIERLKEEDLIITESDINSEIPEVIRKSDISHIEYVKISEGCDNFCSYCIIPKLRGKNRSRKVEDIVAEVERLTLNGAKEIVLIAQNSTDYGIDLYGKRSLSRLLKQIEDIEGNFWVRILYMYPDGIDDELLDTISGSKKILHYFDIPLQHISDSVLKDMNRNTNGEKIRRILDNIKNKVKDAIIRTTIIVGFPGESDEDFKELLDFIDEGQIDKMGVFAYSREEGTPAYDFPNQIDESLKEARRNTLMEKQLEVSEKLLREKIGNKYKVLIDEFAGEGNYIGRSYMDAEEVDGVIYIESDEELEIGDFVEVLITDSLEYDLIGRIV